MPVTAQEPLSGIVRALLGEPCPAGFRLVSAEQFHRMGTARYGDFDPREFYPMIDKGVASDVANDSLLGSYQ